MTSDRESRDSDRREDDFMLAYCDAQRKRVFVISFITAMDARRALGRRL
jgi:hypothetical protein